MHCCPWVWTWLYERIGRLSSKGMVHFTGKSRSIKTYRLRMEIGTEHGLHERSSKACWEWEVIGYYLRKIEFPKREGDLPLNLARVSNTNKMLPRKFRDVEWDHLARRIPMLPMVIVTPWAALDRTTCWIWRWLQGGTCTGCAAEWAARRHWPASQTTSLPTPRRGPALNLGEGGGEGEEERWNHLNPQKSA